MKTKNLFATFLAMLFFTSITAFAQIPDAFSFQAVIRNAQNALVINDEVDVTVSILKENVEVYAETHSGTTNGNGLLTLEIGRGTPTLGSFSDIDWSDGKYFLKVVSNYGEFTTELLSVPYAMYAKKVDMSNMYSKAEVDVIIAKAIDIVNSYVKEKNDGAVPAVFTVSANKKVRFSQGNLQYNAKEDEWRFAEHQYECIGEGNQNISETYDGWIDLFCWGTSGWNSGAKEYLPYSTSTIPDDYIIPSFNMPMMTDQYSEADWGVHNAISNGGNEQNKWRTLSIEEWLYIFESRDNASAKYGLAEVAGVKGCVILPDEWSLPIGLTFTPGVADDEIISNYKKLNEYTADQWTRMETNGAIFLPAAGYREGTTVYALNTFGRYWSTSQGEHNTHARQLYFAPNSVRGDNGRLGAGRAVRLVSDIQ